MKPSIPALRGPGGGLVVAPAEKESLLGSQFDSLTSSSVVGSSSDLCLVYLSRGAIFWEVLLRLLLDHDTYGGVDSLGVFPLFLKMVSDTIAPKLSIIFRGLILRGSFPECWRSANVTAFPKVAPSPNMENFRPISITPILSKVYEKLVSHKLSCFCEKYVFLPAAQFAYRKGLGCTDALRTISHNHQKSLDTGMESYNVQLDFSAAFDRVSH